MKLSELLTRLEEKMTVQNYALDSFRSYRGATRSYFNFLLAHPHLKSLPHARRIEAYLTHRVRQDDISASTQNVEFNALIYLHRHVLGISVDGINSLRARPRLRVPPILSREQVQELLQNLPPDIQLVGMLLYGCGLRVNEALRLRLKDVDFSSNKLVIHQAKGDKERILPIPAMLSQPLRLQVAQALDSWRMDHVGGYGVHLPRARENPSDGILSWTGGNSVRAYPGRDGWRRRAAGNGVWHRKAGPVFGGSRRRRAGRCNP